jgi:phosphoglycerate dehydrogenase-like enzyme
MTFKLAMLQPTAPEMEAVIRSLLPPDFALITINGRSPDDVKAGAADADYCVWWDLPVTADIIAAAPRVKLFHKWGVGVDNIDVDACRARGIRIMRTTGSNAVQVAEATVGLMIAVARRIVQAHIATVAGGWPKTEVWQRSVLVSGKTVGIVGLGAIGKALAKRLRGFDCTILYTNRNRLPAAEEAAIGVQYRPLEALLAECDILSLNCPLTPETARMINAERLAMMKRGALIVNVARGGIVVEADLVAALRSGHIAGAAVDVFDEEPPPKDHPLLHMDNVICTPHTASTARQDPRKSVQRWLDNILKLHRGEELPAGDVVL